MFNPLKRRLRFLLAQNLGTWPVARSLVLGMGAWLLATWPMAVRAENFSPGAASERQTPSGLPVPRYVSLKYDTTNARAGPGDDTRLLWVFRVRALPVQVVAETREWRRICDPDGGLSWVHKRLTDGKRTALRLQARPLAIQKRPVPEAPVTAYLNPRALAELDRCDKGWCQIEVDKVKGWVPSKAVWGTDPAPQCRTSP